MKSTFSTYHPAVNFIFFCAVIGFAIFIMHPVFLTAALAASFVYAVILMGKGMVKFFLLGMAPVILVVTAVNMLTNPRGGTVLFYTEHSQITMESAVYGLMTGMLLAAVMMWFACFGKVMTGDKLMYLFGRMVPAASMIFTMVIRFIPAYRKQIERISDAQKGMGMSVRDGNVTDRARHGVGILSVMFTWALENSIETADSMRARGYGAKKRSAFSLYRFDRRDAAAFAYIVIAAGIVIAGMAAGMGGMEFYPDIVMADGGVAGAAVYGVYVLLCFMPAMMQVKEVITWKYLRSKI